VACCCECGDEPSGSGSTELEEVGPSDCACDQLSNPIMSQKCTTLLCHSRGHCEPGSSISIVSGCGLEDRVIEVRFLAEAKGFFL
jgi:hypothetical protein